MENMIQKVVAIDSLLRNHLVRGHNATSCMHVESHLNERFPHKNFSGTLPEVTRHYFELTGIIYVDSGPSMWMSKSLCCFQNENQRIDTYYDFEAS